MRVFVNAVPREVEKGAEVRAAVGAFDPELARKLDGGAAFVTDARGIEVATGRFSAQMDVSLVNDGPVTILLDSKKVF